MSYNKFGFNHHISNTVLLQSVWGKSISTTSRTLYIIHFDSKREWDFIRNDSSLMASAAKPQSTTPLTYHMRDVLNTAYCICMYGTLYTESTR